MDDSRLLKLARALRAGPGNGHFARTIPPHEHRAQLVRALPIHSRRASFWSVAALGCAAAVMTLLIIHQLAPGDGLFWLVPQGILVTLPICFSLAKHQHTEPRHTEFAGNMREYYQRRCIGLFLLAVLAVITALVLPRWIFGAKQGLGWESVLLMLTAALSTNLIAPNLIDRWRGSDLIYPFREALWRERLLGLFLFIGSCFLLAVMTAVAAWVLGL